MLFAPGLICLLVEGLTTDPKISISVHLKIHQIVAFEKLLNYLIIVKTCICNLNPQVN